MRNTEPTKSRWRNGDPIREQMPTEKVLDLINQASDLGYRGHIKFAYYSDPSCEPRLVSFVKHAREKGLLPVIQTNGALLTDELCKQLDGIVDRAIFGLSNRKPPEYWRARFPKTRDVFVRTDWEDPNAWIITHFFPQKERLEAAIKRNIDSPCHLPHMLFIIQYNGEMSLCCDDLSHLWNLGNAFEASLEELWWSEKHTEILRTLSVPGGRLNYPFCRICPEGDIDLEAEYAAYYRGTSYIGIRPRYM